MNRKFNSLISLFLIILLAACSTVNSDLENKPDIVGYVINKDNQRILVVSKDSRDLSRDGGVAESYPMQSKIGNLTIRSQ